jgi:hypothetical protein
MSFGSAFKAAWNRASDAGRKAATAIAADVNAAKAYALHCGREVADATRTAGVSVGKAATAAGRAAQDAAATAAAAAKTAALAAGKVAKDAAINTRDRVVSAGRKIRVMASASGTRAKSISAAAVNDVYKKVHTTFGRQPVGQPIQKCPDELNAKIKRLDCRQALIARGYEKKDWKSGPSRAEIEKAASRLAENNRVVERARLAQDVYGQPEPGCPSPPVGWKSIRNDPATLAELSLKPAELEDLLSPKDSYFRAEIYKSQLPGDDTIVVAFKGTTVPGGENWASEIAPSISDIWHDLKQAAGFGSDYYSRAMRLAQLVSDRAGTHNLEFTGHSLGGGMSSAASIATKRKSTTFNSAGLDENTLRIYEREESRRTSSKPVGLTRASGANLVQAYHVENEIVTVLQDRKFQSAASLVGIAAGSSAATAALVTSTLQGRPLVYDAVGQPIRLPAVDSKTPDGQGYSRPINDYNPLISVQRHFMSTVIDGIEQQKADDVHLLQTLP